MRNLQEMKELKRFYCTRDERAQQLRLDELSRQRQSQSPVNQLTVQIQELHDMVSFFERFQGILES